MPFIRVFQVCNQGRGQVQHVERERPLAGTRCKGEYSYYIKLELREIGRRGLLDTSGSGRAPLVDRHDSVDERTVPIKGRELLDTSSELL
jgi:hypothetical protein